MAELLLHEDSMWIKKINANSERYLKDVYLTFEKELPSWLMKYYEVSEYDAKDIYQETIYAFYTNIKNGKLIHLKCSLKTYLFAIAKHLCLNQLKKVQREKATDSTLLEFKMDKIGIQEYWNTQEEKLNERSKLILDLLQKINDPCKSILTGFYFERLSTKELAEKLDYSSANVVKVQKHRCMSKFIKRIKAIQI